MKDFSLCMSVRLIYFFTINGVASPNYFSGYQLWPLGGASQLT